jgi:hypothetical protein
MHYLKIVLVKAENKEEAIELAENIVHGYKNIAWDWFDIGGRWNYVLEDNCERLDLCWDKIKDYWEDPVEKARSLMPKEVDFNKWESGYNLKLVSELIRQSFNASHYFYTEKRDISIPENKEEYFAVVFDLHN